MAAREALFKVAAYHRAQGARSQLRLGETSRILRAPSEPRSLGGIALNCVANGKVLRGARSITFGFSRRPATPAAALGAALATYHLYANKPRTVANIPDGM